MSYLSSYKNLPATLNPPLTPREAVADAVYRALAAFDANDVELFKSACAADATVVLNTRTLNGLDALVSGLFTKITQLDTTHTISNTRVNIDGAKALLSATVVTNHFPAGSGSDPSAAHLLTGDLYTVDLVQDGDLWKISQLNLQTVWTDGDASIMQ